MQAKGEKQRIGLWPAYSVFPVARMLVEFRGNMHFLCFEPPVGFGDACCRSLHKGALPASAAVDKSLAEAIAICFGVVTCESSHALPTTWSNAQQRHASFNQESCAAKHNLVPHARQPRHLSRRKANRTPRPSHRSKQQRTRSFDVDGTLQ